MTEPLHGPETAPGASEPRNPAVAFERRDVHFSGVLWFGVFLGGLIVAALLVVYGVYWHFERQRTREIRSGFPVAEAARKRLEKTDPSELLPAAPRLEGVVPVPPGQESGRMLPIARPYAPDGRNRLHSWHWVDEAHTAASIPVSDAITRLLANHAELLKARPGAKPMAFNQSDRPSASNSGRGPAGGGEK